MAVLTSRVDVTSAQIQVNSTADPASNAALVITNRGTAAVYLGPTGVTTATGWQLDVGASVTVDGYSSRDAIFAIAASGTQTLHTIRFGA